MSSPEFSHGDPPMESCVTYGATRGMKEFPKIIGDLSLKDILPQFDQSIFYGHILF